VCAQTDIIVIVQRLSPVFESIFSITLGSPITT
jgi:hypothetical protein